MSLYNKLKSHLPEVKAVISDAESLLINRKDYHLSQISFPNSIIKELQAEISYPYRVLLSFLDQLSASRHDKDFNIVLSDPSLTLAAFVVWVRSGGNRDRGVVYAPKGIGRLPQKESLLGEFLAEFADKCERKTNSKPSGERLNYFTYVLGNTKSGAQTIFAADRFTEAKSGILILKGYARVDAYDEREYLEGRQIFPSVTFEGHGFALKF